MMERHLSCLIYLIAQDVSELIDNGGVSPPAQRDGVRALVNEVYETTLSRGQYCQKP